MLTATHAPVRRVLVVDDDADTRDTLKELLEEQGHVVTCAANGGQALDQLHTALPLPDVILLDLMMPVMNGWEFRGAQKKDPAIASIPVIVITASGSVRERAGLMGVEEIVLKPIRLQQLLGAIAGATSDPRHLH